MKKYTWKEFINLANLDKTSECKICNKSLYLGWEKLTKEQEKILVDCGEFSEAEKYITKNGYTEFHPGGTNYWSKDAPIALAYYPYHESKIRKCNSCNAVFLTYVEYGGHAPQSRCRWVKSDLISVEE